jgi:hypothetical protein
MMCAVASPCHADAPVYAKISEFEALSPAEIKSLQLKLTPSNGDWSGSSTILFVSARDSAQIVRFVPFRHRRFEYASDMLAYDESLGRKTIVLNGRELRRLVQRIGKLDEVRSGPDSTGRSLSFAMVAMVRGRSIGLEVLMDSLGGVALLREMRTALKLNSAASLVINDFACMQEFTSGRRATDVTESVRVEFSDPVLDRSSWQYIVAIRVTNQGTRTLPAPLTLVVRTEWDNELIGIEGNTCFLEPEGEPCLCLSRQPIARGKTISRQLRFLNSDHRPIVLSWKTDDGQLVGPRVLSGDGER